MVYLRPAATAAINWNIVGIVHTRFCHYSFNEYCSPPMQPPHRVARHFTKYFTHWKMPTLGYGSYQLWFLSRTMRDSFFSVQILKRKRTHSYDTIRQCRKVMGSCDRSSAEHKGPKLYTITRLQKESSGFLLYPHSSLLLLFHYSILGKVFLP